jgi:predicted site-specific integrase-resolvase
MNKYVSITAAATALGVSASTLRRWEASGKITPERTKGGQRRYDLVQLMPEKYHGTQVMRQTVAYARVSSHDQKDDLARQMQVLELYCASQGWTFEVVADLGSGMNLLTHKDRLLRFGAELVFAICQAKEVEVIIINKGEDASFEEDLANDVLEIITVFSARLYGSRSRKNQKLIDGVRHAVREAQC